MLNENLLDDFIAEKRKDDYYAFKTKRKHFCRTVFFNRSKLNYWFTLTSDPEKYKTPEECFKAFERWIANNAVRNNIKIIGRYESGEENGRLHFHGFCSFPNGFLEDDFVKVNRYSEKDHKYGNDPLDI